MIRSHNISPDENSILDSVTQSEVKTGKIQSYLRLVSDRYKSSSDWAILKIARSALRSNAFLCEQNILLLVEEGWVYLEGSVESEDQRLLAKKLIRDIFGVGRVINYLTFPRRGLSMSPGFI